MGILHARFDEVAAAERTFREALDAEPDYGATYLNLANLSITSGDAEAALSWLDRADEVRPPGVVSVLLRAQPEHLSGNRNEASDLMAVLSDLAPDVAARYPHLSGAAEPRASEARATPVLPGEVE